MSRVAAQLGIQPANRADKIYEQVRANAQESLYYFALAILGFDKLTEHLHLPAANFLQMMPWNGGGPESSRKMLVMPRGHYKSTLASVALPLWLLLRNRNSTILLISAKEDNTVKWLRAIKTVVESNRWFRFLFPDLIPDLGAKNSKWSETEAILGRDEGAMPTPQASITASSITSGQASQHYDHIILDDPVNEKVVQSASLMETAVELYQYLDSLLTDWSDGSFTLVGTPWGRGDVIEYAMDNDVKSGNRLYWSIGCYGEWGTNVDLKLHPEVQFRGTPGEPIFPSQWPAKTLAWLEEREREKFYLQFLCKPYDIEKSGFHIDRIRYFTLRADGSVDCACHPGHDHQIHRMTVVGQVDPAYSQEVYSDESAIIVNAIAPCECRFILEAKSGQWQPSDLMEKITEVSNAWRPWLTTMGIEAVSFQRVFRFWLENVQGKGQFPEEVTVVDLKTRGREKDVRIRGQQLPVANGLWHIRPGMDKFIDQLTRFPYGKLRDQIDAWAYCDDLWSMPLPRTQIDEESFEDDNDAQENYDLHVAGVGY